ncbi:MAG: hypothetical protein COV60_00950 [Candidatus Magasanikbacteria bacterium CG11_big_fil_rev_8_21_14_0_20_43_7]|uniref:HD/PDEase domain-containing protein n=1 Tax=Candidatus Magasanikbacteria bacterium CG11_big_fil_rev_8_21_14_0_20_43_7 TaxID=1974654 RepID=A0A2H0N341_9BACT|nr:MAG: hypothetical protein COV60_00950 [Candidatus Magasanikbacteria bacterium CG11_big_fil_rev_8_21_14_0_20_43_7]
MYNKKNILLIHDAKIRLINGSDPLHDERHAERVATYAFDIASRLGITGQYEIDALEISAWWHDVSRTITKKPSFLLMPCIDDTLSAIMLGITIIKFRSFSRSSWLAFRLVLSKSVATGKIFSRMFLSKKVHVLLDILHDADTVDTFASERTDVIHDMVGTSRIYERGYKMMIWWFASVEYFDMKTVVAKEYLMQVLKELLEWVSQDHIQIWHIERYGEEWLQKMIDRLIIVMNTLHRELFLVITDV